MDDTLKLQQEQALDERNVEDELRALETGNPVDVIAEVQQEDAPEEIERPYTLRELKDGDLFPMLRILKKIGMDEFKDTAFSLLAGDKSAKDIGTVAIINMVSIIVTNIPSAEKEIYTLWSDISGMPENIIRNMEFGTLPLMIMDTFQSAKSTSFFKVLSKFFS